ncbi:hypothetical protein BJX62DRAFT_131960 [Aspergillus germanicus]
MQTDRISRLSYVVLATFLPVIGRSHEHMFSGESILKLRQDVSRTDRQFLGSGDGHSVEARIGQTSHMQYDKNLSYPIIKASCCHYMLWSYRLYSSLGSSDSV